MLYPITLELIETSDYLHTAVDIFALVKGNRGEWRTTVSGYDAGAQIGVAWYDFDYTEKSKAVARSRQLLKHIKKLRSDAQQCIAPPSTTCIDHAYGNAQRLSFQIKVF